jgi:hypothetical protein
MQRVARVSINNYRNLRTQQMLVHSLVCIFPRHVSAPIGGHLQLENASVISKRVTIVYTVTAFEISYYKPPEDGHQ